MVQVAVYLTPQLSGVQGSVYFVYAGRYYKVYDMPPSVNGLIDFGITTSSPASDYGIIFPAQTIGGVTYLEKYSRLFNLLSPVTLNITLESLVEEVSTSLTISAPSSVKGSTNFNVSGILIRNDTGGPVPYANVALSYNGTSFGSATTGVDGDYLKTVNIPSVGSYTLRASFAGGSGYMGSEASRKIATSLTEPISPWIIALGGLVVVGSTWYLMKRRT